MRRKDAIMAFSQSEKIKAGVIWISQLLELQGGIGDQMGQVILKNLGNMVVQEIQLAKNVTGDQEWDAAEKDMDKAMDRIKAGMNAESIIYLTRALSQVTSIGQRSMAFLKEKALL